MNEYSLKSQINAYAPHMQRYLNCVTKLKKIQDKATQIWGGRADINDPFLMARIAEAILIFRSCNTEVNISSLAGHLNIGRSRLHRVLKIYETNGLYVLKKNKNQTYVYGTAQTIKESILYYEYVAKLIGKE